LGTLVANVIIIPLSHVSLHTKNNKYPALLKTIGTGIEKLFIAGSDDFAQARPECVLLCFSYQSTLFRMPFRICFDHNAFRTAVNYEDLMALKKVLKQ
jgi:hypothetical protein